MHKVLVVMEVLEEHKTLLDNSSPDVEISYIPSKNVTAADVEEVELIVGNF